MMKLTRCIPMAGRDTLFDRVDQGLPSLDRFFGELNGSSEADGKTALRMPRTNIHDEDKAFVLTMEMPGIDREGVEVHVEGDRLIIKGEARETKEEKKPVRREYRSTRYERSFTIGNDVDTEKIVAAMENGVLTVTLPKSEEKVGRKVKIS